MDVHVMLPMAMTLAVLLGQAIKPLPTIEVMAPADVTAVHGLHDTLGTLGEKVTACVSAGRKIEECRCSYPQDLARVRKGYENKEGRNVSGTLVLQNLRRYLEPMKCE